MGTKYPLVWKDKDKEELQVMNKSDGNDDDGR